MNKSTRRLAIASHFLALALQAGEPPGYYASLASVPATPYGQNAALRAAVHGIIDDHAYLEYTPTREALKLVDEDATTADHVFLVYSRRSEPKSNFAVNGNPTTWNREHLWPNSLGIDDVVPSYSDLFNLRPADLDVNSRRANFNFDETSTTEGNVITDAEAPLCTRDSNSWEVPAAEKGDIARSMFYMDVRYEDDAPNEPDLILTDKLNEISTTASKFGRLTTLLLWHFSDPVDAAERLRNDRVYAQQGNRNPFIDRPELVSQVFADPLQIRAELVGNQLKLSWWAELTTSPPQQSTNLAHWTALTGQMTTEGSFRTAMVPLTQNRQFFRLPYRKPDVP